MKGPSAKRGLLSDEKGLHLLSLDVLCLRELGPEFIGYEPEALLEEMTRRYGPIGTVTSERLQVCQLLHANDMFWTEWEVFEKGANTVAGEPVIFSYTQPPDPEEIAVAIVREFSEEVKRYIAACCLFSGLYYLEGKLDISMPFVNEYLLEKDIDLDTDAVADLLDRTSSPFSDPDSKEEVQVNKVLSVRGAVKTFEKQVAAQIKEIVR